jgi:predicted O-methyltransferase YrrM
VRRQIGDDYRHAVAGRAKNAVRSAVHALPHRFRARLAGLIMPGEPPSGAGSDEPGPSADAGLLATAGATEPAAEAGPAGETGQTGPGAGAGPAAGAAPGAGAGAEPGAAPQPAPEPALDEVAELVRRATELPFETWQEHGWHLTPNHFYSPIPDTRALADELWQRESELPGIDMRDDAQLTLLHGIVDRLGAELDALPRQQQEADGGGYFVDNNAFESVDAELYYSMIRTHRPDRVLEIGAGWSTLLAVQALRANRSEAPDTTGHLLAVEPYPYDFVRAALDEASDVAELRDTPLQDLPLDVFESLGQNDILFIDSSHVLRIGSDVQYAFMEVLPRLRPGVLVHVHDIFLPGEYPKDWLLGSEHRFWNEQYLLQAYLSHNSRREVIWGSSWMHRRHPAELEKAFASYDRGTRFPGSFWFRCT